MSTMAFLRFPLSQYGELTYSWKKRCLDYQYIIVSLLRPLLWTMF